MNEEYLLARHAHICLVAGQVVVLDLASGKYLCLDERQARSACGRVRGWPAMSDGDTTDVLPVLLARGLVTRDAALGKPASPVEIPTPSAWLGEFRPRGSPQIRARDVLRFIRATLRAAVSLRLFNLQQILKRIERRKLANRGRSDPSLTEMERVLWIFDWLRPLAFHKHDTCMLYSLALLEFLASYRFYPDWIFGVSMRPFKAHCWLQQQDQLITDIPVNIGVLTPVMVV